MNLIEAKRVLSQGLRIRHKNGQYLMGENWYLEETDGSTGRITSDKEGQTKSIDGWIKTHTGVPYDWNEGWEIVPVEEYIDLRKFTDNPKESGLKNF